MLDLKLPAFKMHRGHKLEQKFKFRLDYKIQFSATCNGCLQKLPCDFIKIRFLSRSYRQGSSVFCQVIHNPALTDRFIF